MPRLVTVMSLAILLSMLGVGPAAADHCSRWDRNCVHTETDDEADSVVTTGVQFPGVDADSVLGKATAAHSKCTGCEWILSPACVANGPTDEQMCLGATESCTGADEVYYRVYFRPSAMAPW